MGIDGSWNVIAIVLGVWRAAFDWYWNNLFLLIFFIHGIGNIHVFIFDLFSFLKIKILSLGGFFIVFIFDSFWKRICSGKSLDDVCDPGNCNGVFLLLMPRIELDCGKLFNLFNED